MWSESLQSKLHSKYIFFKQTDNFHWKSTPNQEPKPRQKQFFSFSTTHKTKTKRQEQTMNQ